jgi:hypothetical protein
MHTANCGLTFLGEDFDVTAWFEPGPPITVNRLVLQLDHGPSFEATGALFDGLSQNGRILDACYEASILGHASMMSDQ